jgi:acetoin utilization protein AcuC
MSAAFVYSPELTRNILREDHVLRPIRLRLVYDLLDAYGAFQRPDSTLLTPRIATPQELLTFHSRDYVEAVAAFSKGEELERQYRYGFSDWGDNPISEGMYEAAALAAGGSLVAAEAVLEGRVPVAFNAGGGYHHAGPDAASGFCIFNDIVLAIQRLLARGVQRVAYVDIDAHHGDAVQNAFYSTDRVLTVSIHESGRFLFPGTGDVVETGEGQGEGFSVNVPLAPATDDEVYIWAFREVVPPLVRAYRPEALVTQLGIDTHINDPLSHLALTSAGHSAAVEELRALSPGRWIAFGGGGYDLSAVARCWSLDYAAMLGLDLPDDIPTPYVERYGLRRLRDPKPDSFNAQAREDAWTFARATVDEVRRRVFPRFGLG